MCRAAHIAVLLALSAAAALADTSPSTDVAEASPMLSSPMPSSPEVSSDNYPLLATLPPLYDFLNASGLATYPLKGGDCWLFPQPAIAVVSGGQAYQIAYQATQSSSNSAASVANAWCLEKGFAAAVDFRQADFNAGQPPAPSLYIGDGTTGTNSAFKYIECANPSATVGAGCSMDGQGNQGWNNTGTSNLGNSNTGSSNVGDFNSGSADVGLFIQGSASRGVGWQCSACPPYPGTNSMLAIAPGFVIPGSH